MNKKLLSLFMAIPLAASVLQGQVSTFNFTGGIQTFTVPCGVTSVFIQTWGAQGGAGAAGGNSVLGGSGGLGGYSEGFLTVTPGDVLNIFVGGQGATPSGGFNGGANGGSQNAGGGGGASDVRLNATAEANRVITAGGGGGGGRGGCHEGSASGGVGGNGGVGGGGVGVNGQDSPQSSGVAGGGKGGNFGSVQGALGAAGIGCSGFLGAPGGTATTGTGAAGGAGQTCCCSSSNSIVGGGGGGGGQLGGGGGGGGSAGTTGCAGNSKGAGGGGGGGSSYTGGVSSGVVNNGIWLGNGQVSISWTSPAPSAHTISGIASFCLGTPSATYTSTTDANSTAYTWTVPSGLTLVSGQGTNTIDITATTAGSYWIYVMGQNVPCSLNGQLDSLMVTVNALPVVTATAATAAICIGGGDILTAGGATTYLWSTSGTAATENVFPTVNSTYTVTGTDINGCVNTATVSVNVNSLPTVALGPDPVQCEGVITLDAGNVGATYLWSDMTTTTQTLQVSNIGVYPVSVEVTDANGCVNSDTVIVTINSNPIITTTSSASTVCAGSIVTMIAAGADTYLWMPGSLTGGTVTVNPTSTTTYTVTGTTTATGCFTDALITITVNQLPAVTGTAADNSVCVDDASVALTGTPSSGTWSGVGVTGSNFSPTVAGVGSQTATYTFTDGNGCTNTASTTIVVSACVGVNEGNILESGISVYPNPTNGIFNINVNANVGDMTIEVVDIEGRVVFTSNEKNVQTGFSKSVSLVGMPNGVYLINLKSAGEHATHSVTLTK